MKRIDLAEKFSTKKQTLSDLVKTLKKQTIAWEQRKDKDSGTQNLIHPSWSIMSLFSENGINFVYNRFCM